MLLQISESVDKRDKCDKKILGTFQWAVREVLLFRERLSYRKIKNVRNNADRHYG